MSDEGRYTDYELCFCFDLAAEAFDWTEFNAYCDEVDSSWEVREMPSGNLVVTVYDRDHQEVEWESGELAITDDVPTLALQGLQDYTFMGDDNRTILSLLHRLRWAGRTVVIADDDGIEAAEKDMPPYDGYEIQVRDEDSYVTHKWGLPRNASDEDFRQRLIMLVDNVFARDIELMEEAQGDDE